MKCVKPGTLPEIVFFGVCYYCHAEWETENIKELKTTNDLNELCYSTKCRTEGCEKQVTFYPKNKKKIP